MSVKMQTVKNLMDPAQNNLYLHGVQGASGENVLGYRSLVNIAWRARKILATLNDAGLSGKVHLTKNPGMKNNNLLLTVRQDTEFSKHHSAYQIYANVNLFGNLASDAYDSSCVFVTMHLEEPIVPVYLSRPSKEIAQQVYAAVASIVGRARWHMLYERYPDLKAHLTRIRFDNNGFTGFNAEFEGPNSGWTDARVAQGSLMTLVQNSGGTWLKSDGAFRSYLWEKFYEDFNNQFTAIINDFISDTAIATNTLTHLDMPEFTKRIRETVEP